MSEFAMPPVDLGETVYWYPNGNPKDKPHVGVVTEVGARALKINCWSPNLALFSLKEGVHHVDDEKLRHPEIAKLGGWGYSDHGVRLRNVEKILSGLAKGKKSDN